ncbi:MAG: hypothetical protein M1825_001765 [Sarcosagium campestre]|nr:MAG: hypothetical protein M1825_001765 [Sarcosagium campestre]
MSGFVAQPARSDDEEVGADVARGLGRDGRVLLESKKNDKSVESNSMNEDEGRSRGGRNGGNGSQEISIAQKMLSATTGSLLTSLLVTPLDVVRVRLQSQPVASGSVEAARTATTLASPRFSNLPPNLGVTSCCREVFWVTNNADFCVAGPLVNVSSSSALPAAAGPECAVEEAQRRNITSTMDGLRKIARNEGVTTLWRGLSPTLVMAIPANVIYFTGYEWLRYNHSSPIASRIPDAYAPLAAGSLARVGAAAAISPIEMFRTRLQASSGNIGPSAAQAHSGSVYTETLRGLRDMVRHQGYTSLWRGLSLTLWRDVPFSGLYWWGYEAVHNALTDARSGVSGSVMTLEGARQRSHHRSLESHAVTLTDSFISGAVSGAVAALVTTPFDVGKTRQQVYHHVGDEAGPKTLANGARRPEERTMPRFLWHIVREEGLAGLWKGWAARCLKVAPACAIMISSYEVGKKMAHGINEGKDVS